MKIALLVIDMQNAFCSTDGSMQRLGLPAERLRVAIPHVRNLVITARAHGAPVIFTRYVYRPDYRDGGLLVSEILPQIRATGALREGSWDVEIIDELRPTADDIVIDKNRYSAFWNTRLDDRLRAFSADTLIIAGVTTSMCLDSTARDAHMRDYRVWVVREATAEYDVARYEHALRTLAFGFGEVINAAEAESRLVRHAQAIPAKETA